MRVRRRSSIAGEEFDVYPYRARSETDFARIERLVHRQTGATHWRLVTGDGMISVFGQEPKARVSDPDDPDRTYQWLLEHRYDPQGNAERWEYVAENLTHVPRGSASEMHRTTRSVSAARHPLRIRYGNTIPFDPALGRLPDDTRWVFQVVFDYGDQDADAPDAARDPSSSWPTRPDPFSQYQAGFEIRTYRLCRRLLVFHHVDELGSDPALVQSIELEYDLDHRHARSGVQLGSISRTGYRSGGPDGHWKESVPPLSFDYTESSVEGEVHEVQDAQVPGGTDGLRFRLVDLNGEGVPGILAERGTAWYYQEPLGDGAYGPLRVVSETPMSVPGRDQLTDIDQDGQLDLTRFEGPGPGFHRAVSPTEEAPSALAEPDRWEPFRPFPAAARLRTGDPQVQRRDLTGNGQGDLAVSELGVLTYFPSDREDGFLPPRRVPLAVDDEEGPIQIAVDIAQGYLEANLSGSGGDVVRVQNGSICYWPHLGHGRFGAKVVMEGGPIFDYSDQFDPARIRFVDLTGTGTDDLLYIGTEDIRYWYNESGNRIGNRHTLSLFPDAGGAASVQVSDVRGETTPCLVWSSPLPQHVHAPVRYVRLQGPVPPYLLLSVSNNMGRTTSLSYRSSAAFYFEAKRNGRPWHTRLPSHVPVVERMVDVDYITGARLITRHVYRDGYFDGAEGTFRGFSCVEQYDTETFEAYPDLDADDYVAPTCTKTWFHTGATGPDRPRSPARRADYYGHDPDAALLPEAVIEGVESHRPETIEEAYRSLAGRVLREEVYAADEDPASDHPYSVVETAYRVRPLQPVVGDPDRDGHHGTFFSFASETLTHHYEQDAADPRVTHQFVLDVDALGYPTRQCEIAYPRRPGADRWPEQERLYARAHETDVIHQVDASSDSVYRHGLPVEARAYEVAGLFPDRNRTFSWAGLREQVATALQAPISFHESLPSDPPRAPAAPVSRLTEWERTYYHDDTGRGTQAAADVAAPARLHHTETAVFDAPLVTTTYGARVDQRLMEDLKFSLTNGYWWQPSATLAYLGPAGFFLPEQSEDAFGHTETTVYDAYHLAAVRQTDAAGNVTQVTLDYAALAPQRVQDPNDNVQETLYDPLGHVVATTTHGDGLDDRGQVSPQGDDPLSTYQVQAELAPGDPSADLIAEVLAAPTRFLQGATTFAGQDLFVWKRDVDAGTAPEDARPVGTVQLARETHVRDLAPGESSRLQMAVAYVDGFGRAVQTKAKAEPGPALVREPVEESEGETVVGGEGSGGSGTTTTTTPVRSRVVEKPDVQDRWIASGGTVYNNKGLPVHQYEPLFTGSPAFEDGDTFLRHGVSPVLRYDPLGRHVRTDTPKGFFSETMIKPWKVQAFDENDTVERSFYFDTQVATGLAAGADRDAIEKAQGHADTPHTRHLDPLGRPFLNQEILAPTDPPLETHTTFDVQGNPVRVVDPRQRQKNQTRPEDEQVATFEYVYDMLGRELHSDNVDRGPRWMLSDALQRPAHLWTARDVHRATTFDALSRPTAVQVTEDSSTPQASTRLAERLTYGEDRPDPQGKDKNLRGRVVEHRDAGGVVTAERYTIHGQLLASNRKLCSDYKDAPDWNGSVGVEPEVFRTVSAFDALGRPTRQERPDGSVHTATYLRRGPLQTLHVIAADGAVDTPFVTDTQYNVRGQRTRIRYGNGVQTTSTYAPDTFRLARRVSQHQGSGNGASRILQEIDYTYDPVGNLTRKADRTRTHLLSSLPLAHDDETLAARYTYDALYRLTEATGWTHRALEQHDHAKDGPPPGAFKGTRHLSLNNGQSLIEYARRYAYDEGGNMREMIHQLQDGSGTPPPGWTRTMWIDAASNRSLPAHRPDGTERPTTPDAFDAAGNLMRLDHLQGPLRWNDQNELMQATIVDRSASDGPNDAEYYVYGADGMRVRKIRETVENGGVVVRETLYLGGCEIYRERRGDLLRAERRTCHVQAGDRRVALVHHWPVDATDRHPNTPLVQYQLGDHLGSAALEVDGTGQIVNYEEYFPYGGSAFIAGNDVAEVHRKRYRYSGKERDDATGLYYYGFRYYAPWLAHWLSPDPAGPVDGLNLYLFLRQRPIQSIDRKGLLTEKEQESLHETAGFVGQWMRLPGDYVIYSVHDDAEHGTVYKESYELMQDDDGQIVHLKINDGLFYTHEEIFGESTSGDSASGPEELKSKEQETSDSQDGDYISETTEEGTKKLDLEGIDDNGSLDEALNASDDIYGISDVPESGPGKSAVGAYAEELEKANRELRKEAANWGNGAAAAAGAWSAVADAGAGAIKAVDTATDVLAFGLSISIFEPLGMVDEAKTDMIARRLDHRIDETKEVIETVSQDPVGTVAQVHEAAVDSTYRAMIGDSSGYFDVSKGITTAALGAAGGSKGTRSLGKIASSRKKGAHVNVEPDRSVRLNEERMEKLAELSDKDGIRWLAGDKELYEQSISARDTRRSSDAITTENVGKVWGNFRSRLGKRLSIKGKEVHHFRKKSENPEDVMNPENLLIMPDRDAHTLLHEAQDATMWTEAAPGMDEQVIRDLFVSASEPLSLRQLRDRIHSSDEFVLDFGDAEVVLDFDVDVNEQKWLLDFAYETVRR